MSQNDCLLLAVMVKFLNIFHAILLLYTLLLSFPPLG